MAEPESNNDAAATNDSNGAAPKRQNRLIKRRRIASIAGAEPGSFIKDGDGWLKLSDKPGRDYYVRRMTRTGIAFSGGGIRSATLSLGLVEALTSRGFFYGFDLMSTVSGGGYFGSFLRSLFVKRELKDQREGDIIKDRIAFADATLNSLPDQQFFRGDRGEPGDAPFVAQGRTVKNPLWWLRENGRYLAPGGMTDYGFALSYIVRNWMTLLIFALAVMMLFFFLVQMGAMLLVDQARSIGPHLGHPDFPNNVLTKLRILDLYSPLLPLLALFLVIGNGIAAAYWISLPLPFARPQPGEKKGRGRLGAFLIMLAGAVLLGLLIMLERSDRIPRDSVAMAWTYGAMVAIGSAILSGAGTWLWPRLMSLIRPPTRTAGATNADYRREQTRWLMRFNIFFLASCTVVLIDVAALNMRQYFDKLGGTGSDADILSASAVSGAVVSAIAFLIAKLPDWLGEKGSKFRQLLVANASYAALAAAVVILAAIALLADFLVIKLIWKGPAWVTGSDYQPYIYGPVIGFLALMVFLLGKTLNFANLLALTPFYGSRLTRAYIGGSNVFRLDVSDRSEVTKGMDGDDVGTITYMTDKGPAPLHLINVTRNRTVGSKIEQKAIDILRDDPLVREDLGHPRGRLASYESSLTIHDRQGDRMVFGPFGVRVGAEFFDWKRDNFDHVPSLGLLCAISGAAVGSGMGRLTSLGSAMAMTLANVRLGYWWIAPTKAPAQDLAAKPSWRDRLPAWFKSEKKEGEASVAIRMKSLPGSAWKRLRRLAHLPSLSCLVNELTGRFGNGPYWYLSDGGHSENSGALSLLERGCDFIVVADNAQDPDFTFDDLEIFIRTARTDIGMEVNVADPRRFPAGLDRIRHYFFNGAPGDWRSRVKNRGDQAFALLLRARDIVRRVDGDWEPRHKGDTWIVWLKPNCFGNLPADIAAYADLNPDFPQQSTSNQFFGEAQWESYRKLGFEMGRRLFDDREAFAEFLPVIYRPSMHDSVPDAQSSAE